MFILAFVFGFVGGYLVKKDYEGLQAQGITVGTISARGWFWGNFWLLLFFLPAYGYCRHQATAALRPQKLYGHPQPPVYPPAGYQPSPPGAYPPPPAPPVAAVTPPVATGGYCSNCGTALAATMKFCGGCGTQTRIGQDA